MVVGIQEGSLGTLEGDPRDTGGVTGDYMDREAIQDPGGGAWDTGGEAGDPGGRAHGLREGIQ